MCCRRRGQPQSPHFDVRYLFTLMEQMLLASVRASDMDKKAQEDQRYVVFPLSKDLCPLPPPTHFPVSLSPPTTTRGTEALPSAQPSYRNVLVSSVPMQRPQESSIFLPRTLSQQRDAAQGEQEVAPIE